jgi:hypothetical protein
MFEGTVRAAVSETVELMYKVADVVPMASKSDEKLPLESIMDV